MVYNQGDLSFANRCTFRRQQELLTNKEKTNVYYRASIIKDAVKKGLFLKRKGTLKEEDKKTIWEGIRDGFKELTDFPSERTADLQAKDAYNQVMRYVSCENRVPQYVPSQELDLSDFLRVRVSPDMVFVSENEIELVKLKTSRPKVTQSGEKRDKSVDTNLELYSLFCYGKKMVPQGRLVNIKASFYYLKKANDSANKNIFDPDFFDTKGAGNIVYLEDEFIGGGATCLFGEKACECCARENNECPYPQMCQNLSDSTIKDALFAPQVETFVDGDDREACSEEMCGTCDFKHICEYKLAPKYIVKEQVVKSIKDLTLTPTQEEAIYLREGICRINAGAGAGKTLVVALRVATMLSEDVKPEEILLLTFTNTGAEEMRTRVKLYNEYFGNTADVSKLLSTTFNAFGDKIVRENYKEIGFEEEPRLIDDVEKSRIIVDLLKKNVVSGLDYRNFEISMKECKGALAITKKCFDLIKAYDLSAGDEDVLYQKLDMDRRFMARNSLEEIILLYSDYDAILRENNLIEFADQEKLVFELLRKNPFYFEDLGIKHIIVDEFQDSNEGQIQLIKELVNCPAFKSLMVVGDDSQAIFSFRDTSPEYIINFFDIMGAQKDGIDIYLLENHRSTPEIIAFANEINSKNTMRVAKNLIATRPSGKAVSVSGFFSKDEEYQYVLEKIEQKLEENVKYEDIAFIASNKFELMEMGNLLSEKGIPWVMLNPEQYMENSRVVGVLDLMKAIEQPSATSCILSYLNCRHENILIQKDAVEVKLLIEEFQREIRKFNTLPDVAKRAKAEEWMTAINDEDEVFESFLKMLSYRKSMQGMLDYCKDFERYGASTAIRRTRDYPGIVLTTAHSSKGLEWPVVINSISKYYTQDLERRNIKSNLERVEEKRRLLFVSATRARDELYITGQYVAFGPKTDRTYNAFLKECYDALGMEFHPVDPFEEERERLKAAEKAARKAEREAKKAEKTGSSKTPKKKAKEIA